MELFMEGFMEFIILLLVVLYPLLLPPPLLPNAPLDMAPKAVCVPYIVLVLAVVAVVAPVINRCRCMAICAMRTFWTFL